MLKYDKIVSQNSALHFTAAVVVGSVTRWLYDLFEYLAFYNDEKVPNSLILPK